MKPASTSGGADGLVADVRAVRARYDRLAPPEVAALRRCRTAADVVLDGTYWRIGGKLAERQTHLAHVILLFPHARHDESRRFAMGTFLRRTLGDEAGAQRRFRRLLDSRERDELDRRLGSVLRLACSGGRGVDWGVLGRDILSFFAEGDDVKRRWARTFYTVAHTSPRAPVPKEAA